MNISILYPWVLSFLVLGIAPLITRDVAPVVYSTFTVFPADWVSTIAAMALRLVRSASLVLLTVGLSGPYLPEKQVERIGEGAQIVLLLDRSRSMDQPFGGEPFKNPLLPAGAETKGTVSRRLLSEFVADRRNDKYGMLVFSTEPIQVLPLTDKTEIILAAIQAGNIGRGLSETSVGPGIIEAINFFKDKAYTGSRVILLVSDGGARLDNATRIHITDMLKRFRVALYWIYIRSRNSPGIVAANADERRDDIAPARVLHEFFETLETPYRAFDAEDPSALTAAIAEVNELQSLPIQYIDIIPRKGIASWFYATTMVLVTLLLIADRTEIRKW